VNIGAATINRRTKTELSVNNFAVCFMSFTTRWVHFQYKGTMNDSTR
jgi:hypothetical protein